MNALFVRHQDSFREAFQKRGYSVITSGSQMDVYSPTGLYQSFGAMGTLDFSLETKIAQLKGGMRGAQSCVLVSFVPGPGHSVLPLIGKKIRVDRMEYREIQWVVDRYINACVPHVSSKM